MTDINKSMIGFGLEGPGLGLGLSFEGPDLGLGLSLEGPGLEPITAGSKLFPQLTAPLSGVYNGFALLSCSP